MTNTTEELIDELRYQRDRLTGSDYPMTAELFSRTVELIEQLQQRNAELERELKESDDDLEATQQSLGELETKYESIESIFCDEDGCPVFEPFTAKNLCDYMNREKAEVARRSFIGGFTATTENFNANAISKKQDLEDLNSMARIYAQRNYGVKDGG